MTRHRRRSSGIESILAVPLVLALAGVCAVVQWLQSLPPWAAALIVVGAIAVVVAIVAAAERAKPTQIQQAVLPPSRPEIPEAIRHEVWIRDGGMCRRCRATTHLAMHHLIPYSKGGDDCAENLEVLCRSCNSSAGATI